MKIINGLIGAYKASKTIQFIVIFGALLFILGQINKKSPEEEAQYKQHQAKLAEDRAKADAEKLKQEKIENSIFSCIVSIKRNLKDPKSYETIDQAVLPLQNGGYRTLIKYRARNSFGGYSIESQWCDFKKLD